MIVNGLRRTLTRQLLRGIWLLAVGVNKPLDCYLGDRTYRIVRLMSVLVGRLRTANHWFELGTTRFIFNKLFVNISVKGEGITVSLSV